MARWVYETLRVPADEVEREVLDHVGHGWLLVTDAVNVPRRAESTLVFKRALAVTPEHRHSIFAAFDDEPVEADQAPARDEGVSDARV